ncbi:hypothetical protein EX30DRAFT_363574 [Ascodesmis nigricans]|uniref:Uncharacterized protein n=1 Tax=Ascodesmis nigricans TaxID=341454 RepID=A0A4V3SIY9_9PEZI|nr:hypothetical protein EX30DRAFT_363574 [Ascodesmis nigricans]
MFRPFLITHLPPSTLTTLTTPPLSLQPRLPASHVADILLPRVSIIVLFSAPVPAASELGGENYQQAVGHRGAEWRMEEWRMEELLGRVDRALARPWPVAVVCVGGGGGNSGVNKHSDEDEELSLTSTASSHGSAWAGEVILALSTHFPQDPLTTLTLPNITNLPPFLETLKSASSLTLTLPEMLPRPEVMLGLCALERRNEHDLFVLTDVVGGVRDLGRVMEVDGAEGVLDEVRRFLGVEFVV